MRTEDLYRLSAAPIYLAMLSVTGLFGLVFLASNPVEAWMGTLRLAWTSWAVVPFVAGNLVVAGLAVRRARRGPLVPAAAIGLVGTFVAFYMSALLLPLPEDEFVSFGALDLLILVPWVGWAGLFAGTVLPLVWGRWEARRFGAGAEPPG